MSLLGPLLAPVRSLLGTVEHEVETAVPATGLADIERHILATGEAIRASTESISSHVAVIEALTESLNAALPALTATLSTTLPELVSAVQELGAKLEIVSEALEPVVAAEQKVANVGQIFHSRHFGGPRPTPDGDDPGPVAA